MFHFLRELRWKLYKFYSKKIQIWGLKNGYITLYDEELIEKLRDIYFGCLPASVTLLCCGMTNGYCYDRALLLSRAFLDDGCDVRLVYGTISSLRLNPGYFGADADHCFVEVTNRTGQRIIYDTSLGYCYQKWIYWLLEHPKVRKINDKQSIIDFLKTNENLHSDNVEDDKYLLPAIIPNIELTYGYGVYSLPGIELLQREVELLKKRVDYLGLCKNFCHAP